MQGDASVEQTQKAVLVDHQPAPKLYIFQESKTQGVPYGMVYLLILSFSPTLSQPIHF